MTREEAIEYIKTNCYGEYCEDDWRNAMDMAIKALQKEVVYGKWIDTTHGLICSACKTYQVYGSRFYNFCPICGADMREI